MVSYQPILAPILNPHLVFAYGDFTANAGSGSAEFREETSIHTFVDGLPRRGTNRFFLINIWSAASDIFPLSDSQYMSVLILVSLLLGCVGIFHLVRRFQKDDIYCGALVFLLVIFYFLNLWAVERLNHTFIWLTYAVMPLFIHLGLGYVEEPRPRELILYSLLFGFFGFLPHSFIYLAIIHGAIFVYSLTRKDTRRMQFLLVPLAIFAFLSAPVITLAGGVIDEYPVPVTGENVGVLSRNGELMNLLAFSNNWWPQISDNMIFQNAFFRNSSILIFVFIFFMYALAFRSLGSEEKKLSLILLACIAALMLVARGDNSRIMDSVIRISWDLGVKNLLGPFREWARIGIIIPSLIIGVLTMSISALKGSSKKASLAFFALLMGLNLIVSPAWIYIHDRYAPIDYGDVFDDLKERVCSDCKVLWEGDQKLEIEADGINAKRRMPFVDWIGSSYPPHSNLSMLSPGSLDALNINHVIFTGNESWYGWLACDDLGMLTVCSRDAASEPFKAYKGTILARDGIKSPASYPAALDYAVSDKVGEHTDFEVVGEMGDVGERKAILIMEAETDFEGDTMTIIDDQASGAKTARTRIIRKNLSIQRSGGYRLAMRGDGDFTASIGDEEFHLSLDGTGFSESRPLQLEEGDEELMIQCMDQDCIADVVWLYEGDGLFSDGASPVLGYEMVDPTLWKVEVDSSEPFLLGFAETYGMEWEARVRRDGDLVEKVRPEMIYGSINGFWINESGKLDIEVRYTPQDGYDLGLLVSAVALVGCIAGLAWVGRR